MTSLSRVRSFLSALFRRRRLEADMDAEWRAHLDAHAEALVAAGMSPADAQRRARMDSAIRCAGKSRPSRCAVPDGSTVSEPTFGMVFGRCGVRRCLRPPSW